MSDRTEKSHTPSALYDALERADVMKRAYYLVLLDDPEFVREADALPEHMRIDREAVRRALQPFEAALPEQGREYAVLGRDEVVQALWANVTRDAQEVALRFAERWGFGAWSSSDAVEAVLLSQAGLGRGPASMFPAVANAGLQTRATRERSITEQVDAAEIVIDPPPFVFRYLPYKTSPKDAREHVENYVQRLRDDAERQLRDAENEFEASGYRPLHPRRLSDGQLALGARVRFDRLARRPPWSWSRIAATEGRDSNTVEGIFKRWNVEIGISGESFSGDDAVEADAHRSI
jgi:hypothetical protein